MGSNGFKYLVFASIISADNDSLTEEAKQSVISRYNKCRHDSEDWNSYDWEYILDPMGDKEKIQRLVKVLRDE